MLSGLVQDMWRGCWALVLLVVCVPANSSSGSDCSTTTTHSLSSVSDRHKAELSHRQHLEALFKRYGENGSISLAGLRRLLQSLGLDRIRTVTVQHHEKPGHHHHDHHHHHHHGNHKHHHHHNHNHSHTVQKHDKNQQPDSHDDHSHDDHSHDDHSHDDHSHDDHSHDDHSHDDHDHNDNHNHNHSDDDHSHDDRDHLDNHHDNHNHGHTHDHNNECLNASTLLSSHGLTPDGGLTMGDFSLLCPSLLDQLDLGACVQHGPRLGTGVRHHHGNHSHMEHSDTPAGESRNVLTAWAGGFTSITIISLLSLLGVVLIPLMNKVFFNFLLSFLVALAVGTLSGSHEHHQHHGDHGDHMEHEEDSLDGVWKGLTALGGVYFMFLIEHFLTLGKMYKDKKNKVIITTMKQLWLSQGVTEAQGAGRSEGGSAALPAGVAEEEQVMLTPAVQVLSAQGYTEQDCENKCHSHFHDTVGQPDQKHHHHHDYHHILHHHHSQNHHPHSHSHSHGMSRLQGGGIASLAWMVVMGDGLHNFSDGLAIGAAFTQGLSSGLSTSVAVFCHELPHELGDFAVLLKAGMTVKQAILYNVLSAMMAYLGMITGILIGHYAENVSMWIFALTAGLFMYVALVDMRGYYALYLVIILFLYKKCLKWFPESFVHV
uniref:Zinc transporter ZIP6 n=1 Tax=Periophthalmus magnuspinnatus TaxID=409849 RepID=A0A3B4BBV0_9GOBI